MTEPEPDPPPGPPDHSVSRDGRLVAYVWARESGGALRRANRQGGDGNVCDVGWADIVCFDPRHEAVFIALIEKSAEVDALLFKLGMEGFEIAAGMVQPHDKLRRF